MDQFHSMLSRGPDVLPAQRPTPHLPTTTPCTLSTSTPNTLSTSTPTLSTPTTQIHATGDIESMEPEMDNDMDTDNDIDIDKAQKGPGAESEYALDPLLHDALTRRMLLDDHGLFSFSPLPFICFLRLGQGSEALPLDDEGFEMFLKNEIISKYGAKLEFLTFYSAILHKIVGKFRNFEQNFKRPNFYIL